MHIWMNDWMNEWMNEILCTIVRVTRTVYRIKKRGGKFGLQIDINWRVLKQIEINCKRKFNFSFLLFSFFFVLFLTYSFMTIGYLDSGQQKWPYCITHTIYNWPLQLFSLDYGPASHITHVVWVSFIRECRNLKFNIDSEQQIFEKLFHGRFIYLLSELLPEICWEEKAEEIYIFFIFRFTAWPGIRTRALGLISQHTTY